MFDRLLYLNDSYPPKSQFVVSNCVNIISEIYKDLRKKYRIPEYVDNYNSFESYLKENDIEEIYIKDLPDICKAILGYTVDNGPKLPIYLQRRVRKLQDFFDITEGRN
jgi:capsule polysaccharide export protein KpsC/LpsZ